MNNRPVRFEELVRHSFTRFFDKESLSPQGQPEANLIQTLGMLVPPGAFVCLLTSVLHPRGWDLAGLRFLFICYSMAAMGVVMVFEWDPLFPDKRDYLILTPLPLRTFTLFAAKLTALALFLGIFLAAINFTGVLLWPAVESQGNPLAVAGAQLAVLTAAGLFSALSIAALQGVLVTLFRGALYRRISVCVQTVLMTALIMFLFLSVLMGTSLPLLCRSNSPFLHWFPGFWFLGLYEQLRPAVSRAGEAGAVLKHTGAFALRSVAIALAIFAATFLPGYRRHARSILEAPEPNPSGPGRIARFGGAALNHWLQDPVECGVFHFISQTIARSLKHRLFLATYGGFGAALVAMTLASGGGSLRVPLTLSFVLISGLRAAFNFPSDLRANWAFQVSETTFAPAYTRATRKWVILCAILPLFLLLAAIDLTRQPFTAAAFHFAFGVSLSLVLSEALFAGFHKVPFTCSHYPGKVNLVFLSVFYVFGFTLYSSYMGALEEWLAAVPLAALLFFLAIAASLLAAHHAGRRPSAGEPGLEFEDDGNPAVRTLGLSQ